MRIAVTGATGHIGGGVARRLAGARSEQLLLVRDANRAPRLPGVEVAEAEFGDREKVCGALRGVDVVLMVSASESADRLERHFVFVDAAAEAGVRHLVYTSFANPGPDAAFTLARDHWATEERIRASGMAFTFLRDNLYADFLPDLAGEDGVIRGPAGEGRVAAVARDDVADVAAAVLGDPAAHEGSTYELTGPEALTLAEVATVLTEVTGRETRYHAETVEEAYASRASYGAPRWQVDAWVSTYTAIAAGELERVTGDVARVAGHPATGLAELLRRG
ncbi:SDR family oxidoreductase [Nonomuraea harbinensis]|uniref:SDR family oxidoreductase n=1 Tax=Nonomuraea harbinensis TaxID=1286938 RepID=A0ABW1BVB2_9ACTN|nr:SDR family oxidoreductase [Nonomuraea harbinensis]